MSSTYAAASAAVTYGRNLGRPSTSASSANSIGETTISKAPARSSSRSAALAPPGLISAETRTLVSRTARGTLLGPDRVRFLDREEHRLVLAQSGAGPDAREYVEAEVGAQRLLHHFRVVLVRAGCANASCPHHVRIDIQGYFLLCRHDGHHTGMMA